MRISAAVMAHPSRAEQANWLYAKLVGMKRFVDVDIVFDEVNEEWHTGRRALMHGIGKGDYHVVIQDDAILSDFYSFYDNLEGAIKSMDQKTLLSLYTGTSRPLGKRVLAAVNKAADGDLLQHHQLFWGVGIAIPTSHIEPMLEFVEDIALQYDNKIGEFYCRNGIPVYYAIPSLVDHDDDKPSLLGHGQSPEPRVAHKLATGPVTWTGKRHYI